jgi:hypothetical protein
MRKRETDIRIPKLAWKYNEENENPEEETA